MSSTVQSAPDRVLVHKLQEESGLGSEVKGSVPQVVAVLTGR